jgi:hypothetical protein
MGNMKRWILLLCLLGGVIAEAGSQSAFVGINTEDPLGVLHIDGGITPAQASDDVLIDTEGRLGAGLQAPTARVHTQAATPGGALRIQDGTQGERKALTSDANGVATWALPQVPGHWPWYAFLNDAPAVGNYSSRTNSTHPVINYAASRISSGSLGSANQTAGTITVPYTGRYRIALTLFYHSAAAPANYWCRAILYVAPSGSSAKTSRWTPSAWGGRVFTSVHTFSSAILALTAGDVLSLALDASQSVNAHQLTVIAFSVEFIQS